MPLTDEYATVTFIGGKGATNSTTPVTVIADPGTGANPYVIEKEDFGVLNEDTVSATIIVKVTGGTSRVIERVTLSSGDRWTNTSRIAVSASETMTIECSAAITTNQLTYQVAYFQIIN